MENQPRCHFFHFSVAERAALIHIQGLAVESFGSYVTVWYARRCGEDETRAPPAVLALSKRHASGFNYS